MITRQDWQNQELPFTSDMLMKTQFESATLLKSFHSSPIIAFALVAQSCHQQGGHPCADKGLKPMEEDNLALAGQGPPQPITATAAALALCHGCGMLSPSSGSQQSQRLTQTVGATMGDDSGSSDDIPLNGDPWVPILSELVADMPNSTLLVRPDDSSGSSDNQLTRQDQLKQGSSAEAAQLVVCIARASSTGTVATDFEPGGGSSSGGRSCDGLALSAEHQSRPWTQTGEVTSCASGATRIEGGQGTSGVGRGAHFGQEADVPAWVHCRSHARAEHAWAQRQGRASAHGAADNKHDEHRLQRTGLHGHDPDRVWKVDRGHDDAIIWVSCVC